MIHLENILCTLYSIEVSSTLQSNYKTMKKRHLPQFVLGNFVYLPIYSFMGFITYIDSVLKYFLLNLRIESLIFGVCIE